MICPICSSMLKVPNEQELDHCLICKGDDHKAIFYISLLDEWCISYIENGINTSIVSNKSYKFTILTIRTDDIRQTTIDYWFDFPEHIDKLFRISKRIRKMSLL